MKEEEKVVKDKEKCPKCGGTLYRHYNLVGEDYMDDGARCEDCNEWTG